MNKKLIWVIIIGIVIIVGVVFANEYLSQNRPVDCCHGEQYATSTTPTSDWKTYTNSKDGYSFQYPAKLSLVTTADAVNLSHTIPFENRDGGCDMVGNAKLSKTLGDFGLSIKVVSGEVKPSYVDGTYSKGVLNGNWAYMGAEGCGQTSYYFPIAGGKTLVITKNEIQILSDVVSPDVKAKVLAVPGVISQQEAKLIVDQILSSFKFTSSVINSTQSSLTVLSPNGNENWVKGSTKTIRWSNPSTQTVSGAGGPQDEISIFINSQPTDTAPLLKTVATGLNKNATSYDWTVGANAENTVLNGQYYIKVCRKTFTCDWSDKPFTITQTVAIPSITVISPNGGEVLKINGSVRVTWNKGNIPADSEVVVFITQGTGSSQKRANITNFVIDGLWKIPAFYTPGSDYKISVSAYPKQRSDCGSSPDCPYLEAIASDNSDNFFTITN